MAFRPRLRRTGVGAGRKLRGDDYWTRAEPLEALLGDHVLGLLAGVEAVAALFAEAAPHDLAAVLGAAPGDFGDWGAALGAGARDTLAPPVLAGVELRFCVFADPLRHWLPAV
jgi:hypothetical protein